MPEAPNAADRALRDLAAGIEIAAPSERLTVAILDRVAAAPVPARSRARVVAAGVHEWLLARLRWLVGVLLSISLIGVGVSPVGAAVAEWFGFHGVVVTTDPDAPTGNPDTPAVEADLSLAEAEALVGFRPHVPEQLGTPAGVSVAADRRAVSMSWGSGADVIRLDQFEAELSPFFWKTVLDSRPVRVASHEGLWIPGPHELVVLDESGEEESVPPRLAAQTLIWVDGTRTLRLEGDLTETAAVELARSVR